VCKNIKFHHKWVRSKNSQYQFLTSLLTKYIRNSNSVIG
jgi:hypothetical protein